MTGKLAAETLCAAYLADAGRPDTDLPWSECSPERLLAVLARNKVPLMGIARRPGSETLWKDARFQEALRAEEDALAWARTEYELVNERQSQAGIDTVLIKSVGLRPSFPFKSDNLDVMYRLHDVESIREILCQQGYIELKNVEEPHKYLFRKFRAGRSVSAIHVHAHVGWMVSFVDEGKLFERRRVAPDDDRLFVPGPEDALLTNLAHWFYEDKQLTLQDVVKIAHCLRQGVDWDEVWRIADWRGWGDGLAISLLLYSCQEAALFQQTLVPGSVLHGAWQRVPRWALATLRRLLGSTSLREPDGDWERGEPTTLASPLSVPFGYSKRLFFAKLLRDSTRGWCQRLKDVLLHLGYGTKLRLRIHSQPSMLVALSGVDGSGKSTQARALQEAFATCNIRTSRDWYRGGSAGWLSVLTRLAKHANRGEQTPSAALKVSARQRRFRSPWVRQAWCWLTAVELLLHYWVRVALPLRLGRVVICDRYGYDALADWSAYFAEPDVAKRLAARVLPALTPRPRLAYWLDVPAEAAQARSHDGLPAPFLEAQRAFYRAVGAQHGLQRIDGSHPWEAISDSLVFEVLTTYFSNYRTWVNSLFLKNPGQWR